MKAKQVQSSLRSAGNYRSDQNAIWDEISERASRRGARSASMAMAEIYEKDRSSIQEYVKHFTLMDSQVGAVFMINGKIAGLDSFGKPDSFSRVFKKLVESYALDAIDWFDPEKEHKPVKTPATNFLKNSLSSQMESRASVGLGTDWRLESKKITGFALSLDNNILHLCLFPKADRNEQTKNGSRMLRYTRRRQIRKL